MEGDKIPIRGFDKLGTVVHESPLDPVIVVEFERVKIFVDKAERKIRLPKHCVKITE